MGLLLQGIRAILRHDSEFDPEWVLEQIGMGSLSVRPLREGDSEGFFLYRVMSLPSDRRALYVVGAYGPGIGPRAMVSAAEELGKELGCDLIRTRTLRPGWARVAGWGVRPYYEMEKGLTNG